MLNLGADPNYKFEPNYQDTDLNNIGYIDVYDLAKKYLNQENFCADLIKSERLLLEVKVHRVLFV